MHKINIVNGKASIAYAGTVPWHRLGQKLDSLMTSEEAINQANLNWSVGLYPVFTSHTDVDGQTIQKVVPGYKATVREDIMETLGLVGSKYSPVQNKDAFNFFDSVVGDGKAKYEVVGALGKGEVIWLLANLSGDGIRIDSTDDIVKRYLLLVNSHNGTMSLRMFFTPIRVVCQNTLNVAFKNKRELSEKGIWLRHSANIAGRIEEARNILGFADKQYSVVGEAFNALSRVNWGDNQIDTYLNRVFKMEETPEDDISTRTKNQLGVVKELVDAPENSLPGIHGTAWGVYNAVTMYVDHVSKARGSSGDASKQLQNIWFGNGARVKRDALSIALSECGLPQVEFSNN